MQIEVFSLCDAATADAGKLNMLGAFDSIWAQKLPVIFPQCAVALRIRFKTVETGEHKIKLNVVDSDGKHILPPLEGSLDFRLPREQASASVNFILSIQPLKVEQFGEYSIDLAVDGRHEASLPLFVREQKAPENIKN